MLLLSKATTFYHFPVGHYTKGNTKLHAHFTQISDNKNADKLAPKTVPDLWGETMFSPVLVMIVDKLMLARSADMCLR